MTLGGLSLAVGILVDDATVAIENIHRHRTMGKSHRRAILDGAQQIAVPTFVATLTICAVFVSVIFLEGPARYCSSRWPWRSCSPCSPPTSSRGPWCR
jgi:multidrug efflux pump subunit AcrB